MSEETEAPEKTGTPETTEAPKEAPPEGQTETPEIDWKQRYEDLRPEADRRASLLADLEGRNGPERQAQALSEHAQIELEEENEETEPNEFDLPDPSEEIAQIKQQLAERDEAAKDAEFAQLEQEYTETTIADLEGKENLKLSNEEYEIVVNYGFSHRDQHDGRPDFEGGFKALKKVQEADRKRYTESKDTFVPPVGTSGEPKIDLRNKEARQKLGQEVYEAAERAKEP